MASKDFFLITNDHHFDLISFSGEHYQSSSETKLSKAMVQLATGVQPVAGVDPVHPAHPVAGLLSLEGERSVVFITCYRCTASGSCIASGRCRGAENSTEQGILRVSGFCNQVFFVDIFCWKKL